MHTHARTLRQLADLQRKRGVLEGLLHRATAGAAASATSNAQAHPERALTTHRPKTPRSPPALALPQSLNCLASVAKSSPATMRARKAASSASACALVFAFMNLLPSGSRHDAGRRLPPCFTSRWLARTESPIAREGVAIC